MVQQHAHNLISNSANVRCIKIKESLPSWITRKPFLNSNVSLLIVLDCTSNRLQIINWWSILQLRWQSRYHLVHPYFAFWINFVSISFDMENPPYPLTLLIKIRIPYKLSNFCLAGTLFSVIIPMFRSLHRPIRRIDSDISSIWQEDSWTSSYPHPIRHYSSVPQPTPS